MENDFLSKRYLTTYQPKLKELTSLNNPPFADSAPRGHLFLSSCDEGVMRNGGRQGSRHGPVTILNQLKKLVPHHEQLKKNDWYLTYSDLLNWNHFKILDKTNDRFESFQNNQSERMLKDIQGTALNVQNKLKNDFCLLHLGGGHDHAYPFLLCLDKIINTEIIIINFDAHTDTRTDKVFHSGTPFRQFAEKSHNKLHLLQIGINESNNSPSNFDPLPNCQRHTYYRCNYWRKNQTINQFININFSNDFFRDKHVFFSIDCDAIWGHSMEAVSSPNGLGLDVLEVYQTIDLIKNMQPQSMSLGIYEYNPLYENLSIKGGKMMAQLIHEFLN
jgi:formiminoglutamase